jgi:hypothetical protein
MLTYVGSTQVWFFSYATALFRITILVALTSQTHILSYMTSHRRGQKNLEIGRPSTIELRVTSDDGDFFDVRVCFMYLNNYPEMYTSPLFSFMHESKLFGSVKNPLSAH